MDSKRLIDMSDYPRAARVYWWMVTLVGAAALSWSAFRTLALHQTNLAWVLTLMLMVFLASLRPIRIHGTMTSVTPGDIFTYLTALFFGPYAAVLVAATDACAGSYRSSRRWTSRLGSPALMSISVLASAAMFRTAMGWLERHQLLTTTSLLAALLLFSAVHFLLNSLLTSALYAIKQGARLLPLWWSTYCWTSLTNVASASTAGLIYISITQSGMSSLVAAAPLVAIVYATCHFYLKQADERAKAIEEVSRVHLATVEALATAINAKDEITHDHVYRVQVYAAGLAKQFGLGDRDIEALKAGALLHDVGKIAVPDYILNKPGKLTAAEFEKMKIHTIVGAQIMERVGFPYPVVPIVRHHHERWDGRGYPDGLSGEQIPLTARILSVVDAFDAIREDRQYRKAMTRDEACAFLRENAGNQFDPGIVEAFLANLPTYEKEIAAQKASQQLVFAPSNQAGISKSGSQAVPAAGLAGVPDETPEYVKQIHATHVEVAALYEMAQTFSASLDVVDVIALTASRLERMIPFTTCVFYLKRERDEAAVAAYAFGKNAEQIRGRILGAGRGITGWVIVNGRPMSNTDAMLDLAQLLEKNQQDYRTAAVYPLTRGDATIGALALYSSEMNAYSAGHLHLMESVSRLASTALQQAMLHEQTKASSRTDTLTALPTGPELYARLDHEMAAAKEGREALVAVSLRLVGLRLVNEAYGYQIGDRVLAEAAQVLLDLIGGRGMLGRIAGDEFICTLRNSSLEAVRQFGRHAATEIERVAQRTSSGDHARVCLDFAVEEYAAGQSVEEFLHAITVATRRSTSLQEVREAELDSALEALTVN